MFIRCWCETCIFTHSITIVVLFILCASRVLTCYPATYYILLCTCSPWNFSETTMSNEYFRLLIEERWSPKMTHNGKPWTGPDQFGELGSTFV